jgi:dTDP-4-dehydrorhamnose reductase
VRVAVIGANGQLGVDICTAFEESGHEVAALTHEKIEISDQDSVIAALHATRASAIVNTAAMHNVEQCENDASRAFAVNAIGARNLARACDELGIYLLHVSTDYVFDGAKRKPYTEVDAPLPLNIYGNSKLAGEHFVRTSCREGAVLRVSGVYGTNPCRAKGGLNFVRLMLKLARERPEIRVVDSEILSPTYSRDIARQVVILVKNRVSGLFHGTAQGECSWFRFAQEIFTLSRTNVRLVTALPGEFPTKVARPSYSVLENRNLAAVGLDIMTPWQDGLKRYLAAVQ